MRINNFVTTDIKGIFSSIIFLFIFNYSYSQPGPISLYKLPFPKDVSRTCSQGNNQNPTHTGTASYAFDFPMPIGSNITASRSGTVSHVEEIWPNSFDGNENHVNRIVIDHGDGTFALYLHLTTNGALKNVGDVVEQGDTIALSGNSGHSTGAHLHFMVMNAGSNAWYNQSIAIKFYDVWLNEGVCQSNHSYTSGPVGLAINNRIEIYGGKVNNTKDLKIWFMFPHNQFYIANIKVGYNFLPTGDASTIVPASTANYYTFNLILPVNLPGWENGNSVDISFDIVSTTSNNIYKYKGKNQLYFLDPNNFTDVSESDWYKNFVTDGANNGLFKGSKVNNEIKFKPTDLLKRSHMAKVIAMTALQLELPNFAINVNIDNGYFDDVTPTNEFFPYIQTLRNLGYVSINTNFNPDDLITAGQFAKILCNGLQITDNDINQHQLANGQGLLGSKILVQTTDPTLQPYLDRICKIVDVNANSQGLLFVQNLARGLYSVTNNDITGSQIIINGSNNISRAVMAKVLLNAYNFKNNQKTKGKASVTGYTLLGDLYELNAQTSGTQPQSYTFTGTLTSGETRSFEYPSSYSNGEPLFFYWISDNFATLTSLSTNHRKVSYTAPIVTTPTNVHVWLIYGTASGKITMAYVTYTVNPTGNTVTTPTVQASNIAKISSGYNNININWTRGNGQYCLVTCTDANNNSNEPINGIVYNANSNFTLAPLTDNNDDSRVVYAGSGNSVNVTNLQSNKTYRFLVYEYNIATNNYSLYNFINPPQTILATDYIYPITVDFTYPFPIVVGTAIDFESNSTNYSTLLWSVDNGATIQSGSIANTAHIYFPNAGNYQVTLTASNATTGQSNYLTKTVSVITQNQTQPDLEVRNLTILPNAITAGQSFTAQCYIANNSAIYTNISNVLFLVSSDQIYGNSDDYWMGSEDCSVTAGQSVLITHNITIPNFFSGGQYYVYAIVDHNSWISESNEENNIKNVPLTILAALPDFVALSITTTPTTVSCGQAFSVTGTFRNLGPGDAQMVPPAEIYLSIDNQLTSDDINTNRILSLNDGNIQCANCPAVTSTNSNVKLSADIPNGNYYLITAIDFSFCGHLCGFDFNYEVSETNNWVATPITVSNPNQPTLPATNLEITNIATNSMRLNWTNGNGTGRIVVVSSNGYLPKYSDDYKTYTPNSNYTLAPAVIYETYTISNSKVVYDGTGSYVDIIGLDESTDYIFNVFEYNGSGLQKDYLQAVPIAGKSAETLSSSSNNWIRKMSMGDYPIQDVHFFDSQNGFALRNNSEIALTNNGGDTWTIKTNVLNISQISSCYIGNYGWIAGGSSNIFKTNNSGQTWLKKINPLNRYSNDVMFVDNNTGFIASGSVSSSGVYDGAIMKTNDGGDTWTLLKGFNSEIYSVFFYDNNNGWATSQIVANNMITNSLILKTSDGGNTWTTIDVSRNDCYRIRKIYFTSLQIGYAIFECGQVLKTTNGGSSWTLIDINGVSFSPSTLFPKINFLNSSIGYITWGGKYITKTVDGGNSWSNIEIIGNSTNINSSIVGLSIVDANTIFVCSAGGLYKTTTGGQSVVINTPTTTQTSICIPQNIDISFTKVGIFNTSNIFKAQLSNENGNFDNPLLIGSLTSIDEGIIACSIPQGLTSGTNYKIRIVATNPATIGGTSNAITINATPNVNISASLANNYYTTDNTVTLTGLGTPLGGIFTINGTTATVFNPSTLGVGTFTVVYTYSNGICSNTATKQVIITAPNIINTNNLANVAYCAGSQISVSFTAQGIYNADNIFTVEMSNANGDFTNAIPINSIAGTTPSVINCTLPISVTQGSGYKIRIKSSSPQIFGTPSNSFTINSINSTSVSIISNYTSICSGQSVFFSATPMNGGTPTYQWKLNGTNVGTNNPMYMTTTLLNSDIVSVQMTSTAACAYPQSILSNEITMSVNPTVTPSVDIYAMNYSLCAGQTADFAAYSINGGSNPAYQWKVNGTNQGTNSPFFSTVLNSNSIISVVLTPNASCTSATTAQANSSITVNQLPQTATIPQGLSNLCINNSNTIYTTNNVTNANSYIWELIPSNAGILTSNGTAATVDWDNLYTGLCMLSVKGHNDCGDGTTSPALMININPLPSINLGKDTMIAQNQSIILNAGVGFASYLWNTNATTSTINVDGSVIGLGEHTFWVLVSDNNTCQNSDTILVGVSVITDIQSIDYNKIIVYPNPATEKLYVQFDNSIIQNADITIKTVTGQLLIKQKFTNSKICELNLSNIAKGLYFVEFATDNQKIVRKIVVQ